MTWRTLDDGKGIPFVPRPPEELRRDGVILARDEVAWLRTRGADASNVDPGEVSSEQLIEGVVADSDGPGQGGSTEEPHTAEW